MRQAGTTSVSVVVDDRACSGSAREPGLGGVRRRAHGYVASISPIAVEIAKTKPDEEYPPRYPDPALQALSVFDDRLAAAGITVTTAWPAARPPRARRRLPGWSPAPVGQIVRCVLHVSENTIAEVLGRLVAVERGLPGELPGRRDGGARRAGLRRPRGSRRAAGRAAPACPRSPGSPRRCWSTRCGWRPGPASAARRSGRSSTTCRSAAGLGTLSDRFTAGAGQGLVRAGEPGAFPASASLAGTVPDPGRPSAGLRGARRPDTARRAAWAPRGDRRVRPTAGRLRLLGGGRVRGRGPERRAGQAGRWAGRLMPPGHAGDRAAATAEVERLRGAADRALPLAEDAGRLAGALDVAGRTGPARVLVVDPAGGMGARGGCSRCSRWPARRCRRDARSPLSWPAPSRSSAPACCGQFDPYFLGTAGTAGHGRHGGHGRRRCRSAPAGRTERPGRRSCDGRGSRRLRPVGVRARADPCAAVRRGSRGWPSHLRSEAGALLEALTGPGEDGAAGSWLGVLRGDGPGPGRDARRRAARAADADHCRDVVLEGHAEVAMDGVPAGSCRGGRSVSGWRRGGPRPAPRRWSAGCSGWTPRSAIPGGRGVRP